MSTEGHTPLPWEMKADRYEIDIFGAGHCVGGLNFSSATRAKAEANASLIVRAVNSHADLVAALEEALAVYSCPIPESNMGYALFLERLGRNTEQIKSALAKAKGQL